MAIYHMAHSFVRRSNGSSVVSKAAYNSGKKIENSQGSTEFSDYTRKGGVLFDEISLPAGSPAWANNRGELWRRLEAREDKSTRRADAILAHSFDIALPHELSLEQNIFLARDLVREQFTRKGYAVDWAIHAADPRGDSRNIHLHVLVPLRKIEGESFGKKDRYDRSQLRQQIRSWRTAWRNLANRHLKRYGHKVMIDERSLKAQGVKRLPTRHRGVKAKTQRKFLDAMRRTPLPKAPIIRTTKHIRTDGTITIRKSIKSSALNKIRFQPTLPLSGGIGTDARGLTPPVNTIRGSSFGNAAPTHNRSDKQSSAHRPSPSFTNPTTGAVSKPDRIDKQSAPVSAMTPTSIHMTNNTSQSSSSGLIGNAVKHIAQDGTISMRVVLPASEFYKPQSRPEQQSQPRPGFAPQKPRRGWPAAAAKDWELWGSKNPARFFALWPELSTGGGGALLDGASP